MRTLLLTALLLAFPGAARAEDGAPPAQAGKPAKPGKAKPSKGAGAKPEVKASGEKAKAAETSGTNTKPAEQPGAKGAAAPPCEPVKPCPID